MDRDMRIIAVLALTYSFLFAVGTDGLMPDEKCNVGLKSIVNRSEDAQTYLLVHGSSHGAWCWYKVVTMLREKGHSVTALDMTSLGKDRTSPDSVATLAQYTKPALDFLANVSGKVIIVGHSSGGIAITYIMEQFAHKIEKAVFLAALMPFSGQQFSLIDPDAPKDVISVYYGDGANAPPTSFFLNPIYAPGTFYNESPEEDVILGLSLLVPHPLRPFEGRLTLTAERYGSIRRFFIRTLKDNAAPASFVEEVIKDNPPEGVYEIDSDHSPFFSKPTEFTSVLEEIRCL